MWGLWVSKDAELNVDFKNINLYKRQNAPKKKKITYHVLHDLFYRLKWTHWPFNRLQCTQLPFFKVTVYSMTFFTGYSVLNDLFLQVTVYSLTFLQVTVYSMTFFTGYIVLNDFFTGYSVLNDLFYRLECNHLPFLQVTVYSMTFFAGYNVFKFQWPFLQVTILLPHLRQLRQLLLMLELMVSNSVK
jgi:hypothetical protein